MSVWRGSTATCAGNMAVKPKCSVSPVVPWAIGSEARIWSFFLLIPFLTRWFRMLWKMQEKGAVSFAAIPVLWHRFRISWHSRLHVPDSSVLLTQLPARVLERVRSWYCPFYAHENSMWMYGEKTNIGPGYNTNLGLAGLYWQVCILQISADLYFCRFIFL